MANNKSELNLNNFASEIIDRVVNPKSCDIVFRFEKKIK